MLELSSHMVVRHVCFFILLAFIVVLVPSVVIPYWYNLIRRIDRQVDSQSYAFHSALLSQVENTVNTLPLHTSAAAKVAQLLNSSINDQPAMFSTLQTNVTSVLYPAFSLVPNLSQIVYTALNGLFFLYYTSGTNQILAVHSNSSLPFEQNNASVPCWYTQPVDNSTGKLAGRATLSCSNSSAEKASWLREVLNSTNYQDSILGNGWNDENLLFFSKARMPGKGALGLGFSAKVFTDLFSGMNFEGGRFYLTMTNGRVLVDGGLPNTSFVATRDSVSFHIQESNGNRDGHKQKTVPCRPYNGFPEGSFLRIGETNYVFYCSPLEVMGVHMVYSLAFPSTGLAADQVHRHSKLAFILLLCMAVTVIISVSVFMLFMFRAARREMHLCAALIKQMEATQQAERKSMNKSLAFASANHDVRASLAAFTGLIEICYDEVAPGSKLETNLMQMEDCSKDLLGILNSILDTSKIEAGKMQLEEEEFDVAQLVEDVVDLYHPVGMKKGVDVVLDLHSSLDKFSKVKGDPGRLKQILCNLLSNAIKFTPEGHVSVGAWAKRPTSVENSILASKENDSLNCLASMFFKISGASEHLETVNGFQKSPNSMEFVFEVNDTGVGIPEEKQKKVFENFAQVRETAHGHEGTGLGLGIVQSLVRLMGGEIAIVNKHVRKRGTCFRFNVFLTSTAVLSAEDSTTKEASDCITGSDSQQNTTATNMHTGLVSRLQGSYVVLLIQSEERRRVARRFFKTVGIKVLVVDQWESLSYTLKNLKNKLNLCNNYSSSGLSDSSSWSEGPHRPNQSSTRAKEQPLSTMDGTDGLSLDRRNNNAVRGASCVLILIDAGAGPFPDLWRAVSEFRREPCTGCCKVVWLDKQTKHSPQHYRVLKEGEPGLTGDHIISKPFHGSRLVEALSLLPEFGSLQQQGAPEKQNREKVAQQCRVAGKTTIQYSRSPTEEITKERSGVHTSSNKKPLDGKVILAAEDTAMSRTIIEAVLTRLGATIRTCENGEEALELVRIGIRNKLEHGASNLLPYDYILMDCQMPKMDGYEATRQIRKEERQYGIYIPIIALTAHDTKGEEADKMVWAGMDLQLVKPLKEAALMEAIRSLSEHCRKS